MGTCSRLSFLNPDLRDGEEKEVCIFGNDGRLELRAGVGPTVDDGVDVDSVVHDVVDDASVVRLDCGKVRRLNRLRTWKRGLRVGRSDRTESVSVVSALYDDGSRRVGRVCDIRRSTVEDKL